MKTFFGLTLALFIAACASEPQSKYPMGADEYGPVPAADPNRTVSVRDCARPFAIDGGNLSCK